MRAAKKLESKLANWKEKAKSRAKALDENKRRIKSLTASREMWKARFKEQRRANRALQKQLSTSPQQSHTAVRHHTYSAELIELCLHLRSTGGCSYRGCVKILQTLILLLHLEFKLPSIWSIRNWEIKYGYHELQSSGRKGDRWVLIIDESVSIGSQKLLLLLGVNLADYDFESALCHSGVRVLDIRLGKSWKGVAIKAVIDDVLGRNYELAYTCCDNGNNLRNALSLSNLTHIPDCGHKLGHWLKISYQKNENFIAFCNATTHMKQQLILSKYAEYVPPKHRTKARFLNISAIIEWANKMFKVIKRYQRQKHPPEVLEKLVWLLDYQDLIKKMTLEQELINRVNEVLKTNGLSEASSKKCKGYIIESKSCSSLKNYILDYLNSTLDALPEEEQIICSSDVIESMFGLFKYRNNKSPCSSITESCLSIANYGNKINKEKVKSAMEKVLIIDLKAWRDKNLPISVHRKRRKVFQKTG